MKLLFIFLILFFSACTDKIRATIVKKTTSVPISSEGNDLSLDTELFFIKDNRVSVDIEGAEYQGFYYEPKSNRYFIARITEPDTNMQTTVLYTNFAIEREYLLNTPVRDDPYHYAGNLSITQRVYTHEKFKEYSYIKTLSPLQNTNSYRSNFLDSTSHKLESTPVPAIITNIHTQDYEYIFTNQQGAFFLNRSSNFLWYTRDPFNRD